MRRPQPAHLHFSPSSSALPGLRSDTAKDPDIPSSNPARSLNPSRALRAGGARRPRKRAGWVNRREQDGAGQRLLRGVPALPSRRPPPRPIPDAARRHQHPTDRGGGKVRREFNVLALIKGDERYVFVYDDVSRPALLELFREKAADSRLSFNWFDAAVLTEKAWEQARNTSTGQGPHKRI